jgi:ABC-type Fe3+ transport system permease subunit
MLSAKFLSGSRGLSLGLDVSLVVAFLLLPLLAAVILAEAGSGFALLHHPVVVLNRLLFGLLTTLCAMLLGGGLAFSVAPSVPGRVLLERLVMMPLYLTPLLTAMGWSWLASPKSGLVNLLLHAAFGARVTIDVVSAAGAIVVTALAAAPLPFLLLSDALRALDPALFGGSARAWRSAPHGVPHHLPLLLPAALASAVLVFVQAIGISASLPYWECRALATATHGSALNFVERITGHIAGSDQTILSQANLVPLLLLMVAIPTALALMSWPPPLKT